MSGPKGGIKMTKVTKEELLAVADRAMLAITEEEADTLY